MTETPAARATSLKVVRWDFRLATWERAAQSI
jgi:hypothetical protein